VRKTAVPKREQRLSFLSVQFFKFNIFSKFCLTYMQLCNCKVDRKNEVIARDTRFRHVPIHSMPMVVELHVKSLIIS
jgi:hypothetical protein